jgi:Zn finger protein HypA/HybF involved in hydrogenase expression
MNAITKRQIELCGETIQESGIRTTCPRCPSNNAEVIKTEHFLITDCEACGFSMGAPREAIS